jgi:hypothetical protein
MPSLAGHCRWTDINFGEDKRKAKTGGETIQLFEQRDLGGNVHGETLNSVTDKLLG